MLYKLKDEPRAMVDSINAEPTKLVIKYKDGSTKRLFYVDMKKEHPAILDDIQNRDLTILHAYLCVESLKMAAANKPEARIYLPFFLKLESVMHDKLVHLQEWADELSENMQTKEDMKDRQKKFNTIMNDFATPDFLLKQKHI